MNATAAATAADCQVADQFSQLPAALLTRILQSLPQRERLRTCATVCKSWAEAAAAATVELDVSFGPRKRIAAFEPWLEQHANQLVSLRVLGSYYKIKYFHLPCGKLQQLSRLDLEGLKVRLKPAAGDSSSSSSINAGAAPMPGKLQKLRLHNCKLSRTTLLHLAQLSGVHKLELDLSPGSHCTMRARTGGPFPKPEAVKRLLQGMSNLECLRLAGPTDMADIMSVLPAHSLTALTLHWMKLPDSASRLINLRELKLTAELNPVALASMTMLTKLQLTCRRTAAGVDDDSSGFLAAVRGMRQLQHLEVFDSVRALLQTAELRACAALTASSQLTYLEIRAMDGQPLPATALQHMFPAGKQLPRLQYCGIRTWNDSQDAGCITAAELSSLVDACPGLIRLDLTCVLAPEANVSALLKLPQQCQHLAVGGQAFVDEAAGVVAQLTQLTRLHWVKSRGLTDAGLARLTALHALNSLVMEGNNLSRNFFPRYSVQYVTKAGGQSVSQQLCELLLAAPSSAPWKQQLQEQQNKIAAMQDRLEQQQEEITTVQDRLRELSCST